MKNIIWPSDKNIKPQLVGNKAWRLIQLKRQRLNVPQFFVITTLAFNSSSFYLEKEILENFDKLASLRVAVRSSATCEDLESSSFAGQFESYLGIRRGKLLETVKKCWASTKNERILTYAKYHHIPLISIRMAVIIQEMIFAEKGGVIFTQNVFKNDLNHLIIEAAAGLGEKVVSGLVNPERIIVDKTSQKVLEKESPEERVLTAREIKGLTNTALKIEKFYRSPQDIEWAIKDGKVYILQSRPITT